MEISDFQLERFFAKYEFSARYLLSSSDCESLSQSELLSIADAEMIQLSCSFDSSVTHPGRDKTKDVSKIHKIHPPPRSLSIRHLHGRPL